MKDNRTQQVKEICESYLGTWQSCEGCPLSKPCAAQYGDTKTIVDQRLNNAAEELQLDEAA